MSNIFEGFLSTPEALESLGDRNFVSAMLRFEAALVRAQAKVGLIPEAAAQSIIGTCKVDLFDVAKIVRESGRVGSVASSLIANLKETVGLFNQDAVAFVNFGCASQDVMDSAMALITRNVLDLIDADVSKAVVAVLALAERYAAAPILVRTSIPPVSVSSFGLTCTNWAAPLVRSLHRLRGTAGCALSVQLRGAIGAPVLSGELGREVIRLMAQDLSLSVPRLPWHTQRDEWAALGCELGLLAGGLGKIAKDISFMAQYEVGEVMESGACRVALAAATSAPQHVAALLAAMVQAHELPSDSWQIELAEWAHLLLSAHGSARALAQILPDLQVNPERMLAHIEGLRMRVSKEVADQCFDPALAVQAGQLSTTSVKVLQNALAMPLSGVAN